ncbi:MAG: DUF4349 domain-containing protein [Chloroflexota bacterium]
MRTRPVMKLVLVLLFTFTAACSQPAQPAVQLPNEAEERARESGAPAAAAPTMSPSTASAAGTDSDVALIGHNPASRMVIKDGLMELLVEDTDVALAQVTRLAADYGGYILDSETWYNENFKYGRMRLGIPSGSFEAALNGLRRLGIRVIKETASGQDVSAEYTDLQSKLTNLEATAARVREFLAAAQTVEESLTINETLAGLEAQIEEAKGQMNYYEGRSAFSTITVELTPQRPTPTPAPTATPTLVPPPPPGWNPGDTFDAASGVLVGILQQLTDLLIWFVVVLGPFGLILGVLYWIATQVGKRLWRQAR